MEAAEQIEIISSLISRANYYGLTPEIVYSALILMKEDPSIMPVVAMTQAVRDWDVYLTSENQ